MEIETSRSDEETSSPSSNNTHRQPMDLAFAQVPKGQVYVIPERCKGCNYCIVFCPMNVLEFSSDINKKGYHYAVVAEGKEEACVHCRFCDLVCPEMAIYTKEITNEETEGQSDSPDGES